MDGQMSLFDFAPQEADRRISSRLKIVKAKFINEEETDWRDLFEGYNEIYGITFSSGISFKFVS